MYVVTDEHNETILSDFTAEEFKLFRNLHILSSQLTSLDEAVIELGLITASTRQICFGNSSYAVFSEIVHTQRYHQFDENGEKC